jgi:SAM-dependent methyltransferase
MNTAMPISVNATIQARCVRCGTGPHVQFLSGLVDRLAMAKGQFTYIRCLNCELISLHPLPEPSIIGSFYPQTFWRTDEQATAPGLLRRIEAWYRNWLQWQDLMLIRSYLKPGVRHLDVGCATGDFLLLARARGTISTGIEFNPGAVQFAVEERGLDVVAGDLPEYDFEGTSFDLITYFSGLEHVPNPLDHLRKCRTLLRAGGSLCIMGVPNIESLGFKLSGRRWMGLDCPRHLYQFSRASLGRMLETAGFHPVAWSTRSPRSSRSLLVGSVLPALHRHAFDLYERRTGRNPIERKIALFALFQAAIPLDWIASGLSYGELMNCIAVPAGAVS